MPGRMMARRMGLEPSAPGQLGCPTLKRVQDEIVMEETELEEEEPDEPEEAAPQTLGQRAKSALSSMFGISAGEDDELPG